MNRKGFILLSLVSLILGILFLLNTQTSNITGAVIGLSNISSGLSSIFGIICILFSSVFFVSANNLKDITYDTHAYDRMEERKIFPSVIKDAIKNGEHYKLKHVNNFGETKGATDAYIRRNSTDVLPGKGKIGERIIKVNGPSEKREYKNVIVLTNGKQVKTMYVRTDNELESFLKKYVK